MKLDKSILLSNDPAELKKAQLSLIRKIPKAAFEPSSVRSWSYLVMDFAIVSGLFCAGTYAWNLGSWLLGALYVLLQGFFFVSVFVVGHDSGHESFSKRKWENALSGYLTHSFLLVPFYSWKMSHHKHHTYHHCLEKDESYMPKSVSWIIEYEKKMRKASVFTKLRLQTLGILDKCCFTFIIYLFSSSPLGYRDSYSHFDPRAEIFAGREKHIWLSLGCVGVMAAGLVFAAVQTSVLFMVYLYALPWVLQNMIIFMLTYLQHTNEDNYFFYKKDWHFFKGAMQTVDYDYGFFAPVINFFHHNISAYHFIHHLNLKIPHYRLKMAQDALHEDIVEIRAVKKHPFRQLVKYKYRAKLRAIRDYTDGITHYQREFLDTRNPPAYYLKDQEVKFHQAVDAISSVDEAVGESSKRSA